MRVGEREENAKSQINCMSFVVFFFKLQVNIFWYVNNIFCCLDYLFMVSIHLLALSSLIYIYIYIYIYIG